MARGKVTAPTKGKASAKSKAPAKAPAKSKAPAKGKAEEKSSKGNGDKAPKTETLTLVLTSEQLDGFLDEYVCSVTVKQAKGKLLSFKGNGDKASASASASASAKDPKGSAASDKNLSPADLAKLSAKDLETLALKKSKKEKKKIPIAGKGKNPTKKDNIDFHRR